MSPVRFQAAKLGNLRLVIGVIGGTGSGKTNSALRLAKGIAGNEKWAVLDTEANRALHYADQFQFDHAVLESPFRPARFTEAIQDAEKAGYRVLVVDSMSHVWSGPGGVLEWHDELMGGREARKMTAWIEPKTEHRRMVNAITQMKTMHLVLAFRAQQKVDMVKVDGKWEVVPKKSLTGLDGWIPICESQFPHELTMSLLLTADAPGVPKPVKLEGKHRPLVPLNAPLTEATGAALARWASGQEPGTTADAKALEAEVTKLTARALELTDDDAKRAERQENLERARAKFDDIGAFLAWLGAQVERLEAQAAAREQEQMDL
ncbi:MAG: AAA family ATPase [Solirubrobacteraceae bacterium]